MYWQRRANFSDILAHLRPMVSAIRNRPALVFGGVVLITVLGLVLQNRSHIFTLDVITEIVAFTTTDPVLTAWDLGATSRLYDNPDPFAENETGRKLEPNAQLIIHDGTRVDMQRHGTGVIRVQLTRDDAARPIDRIERSGTAEKRSTDRIGQSDAAKEHSIGRIEQSDTAIELNDWAVLQVEPAGTPALFPFRGTLTVGYDVAAGVDSVLLSGTVSVVEEQLIGNTHYTANAESIDAGDRVQLRRKPKKDESPPVLATVSGFVRAEPATGYSEPIDALNLVAHGQADFVQVDRLGSAGYKIRATRWARFLHDPLLAAGTAIVALFALLVEVGSKCREGIWAWRRKNDAGKDASQAVGLAENSDEDA